MSPRHTCARVISETARFHLKVEQSACIQTVVECRNVRDVLNFLDRASLFEMVGVTEYLEEECSLWNLVGICLQGLVGGGISRAVG